MRFTDNPKHLGSEPGPCRGPVALTATCRGASRVAGLTPAGVGEELPKSLTCRTWKILPVGKGGWKAMAEEALEEPGVARLTVSFLQERFHATLNK